MQRTQDTAIDTAALAALGCTVELTGWCHMPYLVTTTRSTYILFRHGSLLYPLRWDATRQSPNGQARIKGQFYFSDQGGILRPWNG